MKPKKIPTIFGFIILISIIVGFAKLYDTVLPKFSKPNTSIMPKEATISNISDTSFTVSWLTDTPATGAVLATQALEAVTSYDDRDSLAVNSKDRSKQGKYTTHIVTIRNLKPETKYNFQIISGDKPFTDNGKQYQVMTGKTLATTGNDLEPAFGSVTLPSAKPASGALVYLSLEGSQTLVALVNMSGSWLVPLHLLRTQDLNEYMSGTERKTEHITIRSTDGETTAITDTLNDNPVPAMDINKTYDFRKIQAMVAPSQNPTSTPPNSNTPITPTVLHTEEKITINQPANESRLESSLPTFEGYALPGKQVQLVIGITNPISAMTTAGTDGMWHYTPTKGLSLGKQSVTITTNDAKGKPIALTHMFNVVKNTQVLGDATDSATITQTPTETPTPTIEMTGDPIPETGASLPLVLFLILGVVLVLSGIFLHLPTSS